MLEFWVTKKLMESKKSLRTMVRFLTKLVRNPTKLVRNLGIYPEVRIALRDAFKKKKNGFKDIVPKGGRGSGPNPKIFVCEIGT